MTENISPRYGVSRVDGDTLDLLEDEEVRIVKLTALQCSVVRQMVFPWVYYRERLVNEFPSYWEIVEQPQAYKDSLEELELMMGGGYVWPGGVNMGEEYVDRGDASGYDYTISSWTADGNWHDKTAAGIVFDYGATRMLLRVRIKDGTVGQGMGFRSEAYSGVYNQATIITLVANVYHYADLWVPLGPELGFDYYVASGMDVADAVVRGWWIPASQ
jgi:hypothetical protein